MGEQRTGTFHQTRERFRTSQLIEVLVRISPGTHCEDSFRGQTTELRILCAVEIPAPLPAPQLPFAAATWSMPHPRRSVKAKSRPKIKMPKSGVSYVRHYVNIWVTIRATIRRFNTIDRESRVAVVARAATHVPVDLQRLPRGTLPSECCRALDAPARECFAQSRVARGAH